MEYKVILVEKHDTAQSVARKYKTTERSLFSLNNPRFFEGERLIIEVLEGNRYTVMPFDTLESVAVKFNTTVDYLKKLNGDCTKIFLGESLIVPDEKI